MSKRNPILATIAAVSFLVLVNASGAFAQQSKDQQKCLNALNKDGAGVAKTQGKATISCHKDKGKGKLVGSAQACLTADSKGKVQKAKDKTTADETKSCGTAPGFGYTSAATINTAAVQGELDLENDIFGGDLDAATIDCVADKTGCQCQQKILKDVEKLADTKLAEFVKCKKAALKAGANSITSLRDCVNNAGTAGSIAADSSGKIQKGVDKITADVVKSCTGVAIGTAFPGGCNGATSVQLPTCLDEKVECRVCQILNEMDGLFVNCDLFDNGVADMSCASGTGPTPTPSPTLTPTPTPTSTPGAGIFKGRLTDSSGRFNYNLTLGLAGSDAACNTAFAGSHTCSLAELQAADAANELLAQPNTNFWAIDSAQPLNRQCALTIRWDYQTADHPSFGDKVTLSAGHIGALQPSQICAFSGSVGCCM